MCKYILVVLNDECFQTTYKELKQFMHGIVAGEYCVNAAALCPAVDVVNCPYIDGIGVHM